MKAYNEMKIVISIYQMLQYGPAVENRGQKMETRLQINMFATVEQSLRAARLQFCFHEGSLVDCYKTLTQKTDRLNIYKNQT